MVYHRDQFWDQLFFLLYINDICSSSPSGRFLLFADDTTVIFPVNKNMDTTITLNTELNRIFTWLQVNKLSLNTKKTQAIAYNFPNFKSINLEIKNEKLPMVDEINFIGIIFDKDLCWKPHIFRTFKKVHSGVGGLIRCKNILPRKILKTIYFSIIHPHIIYGIVLWGSAGKSVLRPLLNCHSRAVKLCQQNNTSGLLLPKLFEAQ